MSRGIRDFLELIMRSRPRRDEDESTAPSMRSGSMRSSREFEGNPRNSYDELRDMRERTSMRHSISRPREMFRGCGFDPEREEREERDLSRYYRRRMRMGMRRSSSSSDDSPERGRNLPKPPLADFRLRSNRPYLDIMDLFRRRPTRENK